MRVYRQKATCGLLTGNYVKSRGRLSDVPAYDRNARVQKPNVFSLNLSEFTYYLRVILVRAVALRSGISCKCRANCCDRLLGQRGCRSKVRISRHHRASTSWLSTTTHSSSSWQGRSASSESKCRTQWRAEQKGRGFLYKYMAFVTAEFGRLVFTAAQPPS